MIGIKSSLDKYVSIVDVSFDTLVWLKVSSLISGLNDHLYICCAYIPPDKSSFFKHYNCDIFYEIESQVATYSNYGKVMIIGDLNGRCANLN